MKRIHRELKGHLYDRVLRAGVDSLDVDTPPMPGVLDDMRRAEIFDVHNIAEYYFTTKDTFTEWDMSDMPNLAPPYPATWMEFQPKPIAHYMTFDDLDDLHTAFQATGVGVLAVAAPITSYRSLLNPITGADGYEVEFPLTGRSGKKLGTIRADDDDPERFIEVASSEEPPHWGIRYTVVMESSRRPRPVLMSNSYVVLDRFGRRLLLRGDLDFFGEAFVENRTAFPTICQGVLRLFVMPTMLATTFLHAHGIEVVDEPPSPKAAKIYRKEHGRDMATVKTLRIQPVTRVLREAGAESKTEGEGLKKALHKVRGHFAYYGMKHPADGRERGKLFGKISGIVWHPDQTRGRAEAGVVVKDYKVERPKEEAE